MTGPCAGEVLQKSITFAAAGKVDGVSDWQAGVAPEERWPTIGAASTASI